MMRAPTLLGRRHVSMLARRRFLRRTIQLCGMLPFVGFVSCASDRSLDRAASRAAAYLAPLDLRSAQTLGARYLAQAVPGGRPEMIQAALQPIVDLIDAAADEVEATARVREAVAADFLAGRTVILEGWTLSTTEVSICALLLWKPPRL